MEKKEIKEKKLTDEEIVKALEHCIDESVGCVGCPYHGNSCRQMDIDMLDLIHRLQEENADYKRKFEDGELVSKEWHDEQVLMLLRERDNLADYVKILKKEVDELKEKIMNLKSAMSDRVAIKSYDDLLTMPEDVEEIFGDAYESEFNKFLQQAVKDTAKEIFETIFYDCWAIKDENGHRIFVEGKIKDFAKKCYGVEVE